MNKSNFLYDLSQEQRLSKFLDLYYAKIPNIFSKRFKIQRINDEKRQHEGIDLIITDTTNNSEYLIDEKAQLTYINKALPTFAFELSYLKNGALRQGWLFDEKKKTDKYFVITCIEEKEKQFKSCRIISIDRKKLQTLIEKKISREKLDIESEKIRDKNQGGRIDMAEFNKNECSLNFSNKLAEKPINIVFYLNYLIKSGVGKELTPCQL